MRTIDSLDELAALMEGRRPDLYIRWSRGPEVDLDRQASRDELTNVELPGLSANALAVEPWWGDRSRRLWVARRLYDYRHLRVRRGPGVRPWVFVGDELARGPDNEPLVRCLEPVAWIADAVVDEAVELVEDSPGEWGPLDRNASDVERVRSD